MNHSPIATRISRPSHRLVSAWACESRLPGGVPSSESTQTSLPVNGERRRGGGPDGVDFVL